MDKKTPLFDIHVEAGGKMVPFAGYSLPVQYRTGIKNEHMAVRTACGIFDVSHMGEITIKGSDALLYLNHLLTNDFNGLEHGQARYSPMCYENGGTVDDLIVYMRDENDYMAVVNAANREKDFSHMKDQNAGFDVRLADESDEWGQIALQGPSAEAILSKLADESSIPCESYTCVWDAVMSGIPCMISRTGYTGEDGFEIYTRSEDTAEAWNKLISAGNDFGLIPCGLGARDTLRMEAGMPLYGHEMNENISPKTAGLGFAVKMDKEEFIGKDALAAAMPLKERRVGLKVTGRGIVRDGCKVYRDGKEIGFVTSGTFLPYLNGAYALAIVSSDAREIGATCQAEVRGRMIECEMVKPQFYKRER